MNGVIRLAAAVMAVAFSSHALAVCSAPEYDTSVSVFESGNPGEVPPTLYGIGGAGITNGSFSRCRDERGIDLGLRIIERGVGQITPTDDSYTAPQGEDTDGNAKWNFDWHIDMGHAYGNGFAPANLSELDSLILQIDCDPVVGQVTGPAIDLVELAAFDFIFYPSTAILMQGSDNLGFALRCPGMEFDPAADGSYEFSLTAMYDGSEVGQATATAVVGQPPPPPRPGENAYFNVFKLYDDGNIAEVEVQLECNGGTPLSQPFPLVPYYAEGPNNTVKFTLENIPDEGVDNCTVSEISVPDGYEPVYFDLSGMGTADEDGCHYENVENGMEVLCMVGNVLQPSPLEVTKVWLVEEDDIIDLRSKITVSCSPVAPDADDEWMFLADFENADEDGEEDFTAYVYPAWGEDGTECSVDEMNYSDAVETEGCEDDLEISVGSRGVGCTLINTVFLEGVPTLSWKGLALMAMLMLAVGIVGFRRIV